MVVKSARLDGTVQPPTETVVTDWQKEFDMFTAAGINKPALRGAYHVDSTDAKTVYTALENRLKTRMLKVEKRPDGSLERVSVLQEESNIVYGYSREMEIETMNGMVSHYTLKETRRFLWFPPEAFAVEAGIRY